MPLVSVNGGGRRVLIVDLNNFSTFPTLAVGIIVAALRNSGNAVKLISPLANDVPAAEREHAETIVDHYQRRLHLSTLAPARGIRDAARSLRSWWRERPHPRVVAETVLALEEQPDVLLLSAYLQHFPTVQALGRVAARRGIPLILGGPMFNLPNTASAWRAIPGLTAIVGAEVDLNISEIVEAACNGDDLTAFPGVTLPNGMQSKAAPPLRALDLTPLPDFTDFPWDRYRMHVIPLMASRGCQWNKCNFCSDIISASGRTYRNRSVESVLHEMREQSRRHRSKDFIFLDLKLNSNPNLLRGIVENVQSNIRGAQWIGTVHVDERADNGLSRRELKLAVAAGMRRISFGLESGSQRLLDAMSKGSTVEGNSEFIRNAFDVGLSVRCTMFKGYPGETAADLELSADFLERHLPYIDRVRFNDFTLLDGTELSDQIHANPEAFPNFSVSQARPRRAQSLYVNRGGNGAAYRHAKSRVLRAVFEINRRKIRSSARVFDGLM